MLTCIKCLSRKNQLIADEFTMSKDLKGQSEPSVWPGLTIIWLHLRYGSEAIGHFIFSGKGS
jgi:hypothetical protein